MMMTWLHDVFSGLLREPVLTTFQQRLEGLSPFVNDCSLRSLHSGINNDNLAE
jgi:hypothetical protein